MADKKRARMGLDNRLRRLRRLRRLQRPAPPCKFL